MKSINKIFVFLFLIVGFTNVKAQLIDKKSSVDLHFTFLNDASTGVKVNSSGPAVKIDNEISGGGLFYTRHLSSSWAVFVGGSLYSVDVAYLVRPTKTETSRVVPIAAGIKYFITGYNNVFPVKFYGKVGVGLIFGYSPKSDITSESSKLENSFLTTFGLGGEVVVGSAMKLGLEAGYLAMSDFKSTIAGRNNYSGSSFSVIFGFMF